VGDGQFGLIHESVRTGGHPPVRIYYVHILTNRSRAHYTGGTNDIERRLYEHRRGTGSRFTRLHGFHTLVYADGFASIHDASAREKEIKGWLRAGKIALIESANPEWRDLSEEWFGEDGRG
jgi:putative endonuclease